MILICSALSLAGAVGFIVMTLAKPVLNLVRYLSTSDELATRRPRAWWVTGTLAAGAVVLQEVPPCKTVAGVPARIVGEAGCDQPAMSMDQMLGQG